MRKNLLFAAFLLFGLLQACSNDKAKSGSQDSQGEAIDTTTQQLRESAQEIEEQLDSLESALEDLEDLD